MGNPVVHFEVTGTDGPALEKFYADLFGWHVQSMPEMNYGIVDTHSGGGINGGIGQTDRGRGFVTFYVEVDDPQAYLDKATALGGTTVMPVMNIPGSVTLAQLADFDGNIVGLVKSGGMPEMPKSEGSNPGVDWFEIGSSDPPRARKFYSELFGWTVKAGAEYGDYAEVEAPDARGIGGGIGPAQGPGPYVTVYSKVDDLAPVLDRATSLGGMVVLQPMAVGEHLTVAGFVDPQGNFFGLFRHTA